MAKSRVVNKKEKENLFYKVLSWIKSNKLESSILLTIVLLGAFFRLFRISEYMTFLGDEGRDAIIVRRLLVYFDPILIGPGTSIGNMYLGPLYYYLSAPFLWVFGLNPVGPSVMVALFGVATIIFVWFCTRVMFPVYMSDAKNSELHHGAIAAACLYAISPVVINFSRSSWNPNIMPFFAMLTIFSIWKAWTQRVFKWFIVSGISTAFVLQSHYLGLLLIPIIVIIWFLTSYNISKLPPASHRVVYKKFLVSTLLGVTLFLFLMSPLFVFDYRHNWTNFSAMREFFTKRQTTVSARPWTALPEVPEISSTAISRLIVATDEKLGRFSNTLFLAFLFLAFAIVWSDRNSGYQDRRRFLTNSYFLILIWIVIACVGLGLYKQHIYDHYYGFFFPAPFILLGAVFQNVWNKNNFLFRCILLSIIFILVYINLKNSPLKNAPNRQMQRAQEVSALIKEKSDGHKFNLAVIAENNYEDGYQYFLEKENLPVYDIDPLDYSRTLADQLFVVCEMTEEKCNPVNSPKAGIANFGWSKISDSWRVSDVIVYKLVHAK